MGKKIKKTIDRAKLIEMLIDDVTAWDLELLLRFAREGRERDLRHMTNEELLAASVEASLEGTEDIVEVTGTEPEDETSKLDEKITEAARRHGIDSEEGMEVGDLQEALYAAWKELDPAARQRVFDSLTLWES